MDVYQLMGFICYSVTIGTIGFNLGKFYARKNRPNPDQR